MESEITEEELEIELERWRHDKERGAMMDFNKLKENKKWKNVLTAVQILMMVLEEDLTRVNYVQDV